MMTKRGLCIAVGLAGIVGCASPEAGRTRGGGPGGDPGNHDLVTQLHAGARIYYHTPCRTTKVKCSGPMPAANPRGT